MINAYDEKTADYYQARSTNVQSTNWSEKVRQHFEYPRRQNTVEFLRKPPENESPVDFLYD